VSPNRPRIRCSRTPAVWGTRGVYGTRTESAKPAINTIVTRACATLGELRATALALVS